MTLRPFTPADRAACLAVFDSNVPDFFLPHERAEFEAFLSGHERGEWAPSLYLVAQEAGEVLACGGVYLKPGGVAGLAWGMVARAHHRQGLGRALLEARLAWLREQPGAAELHLDTTQHSAPFFRRFGFEVLKETPDGYGPGMHRLDMRLTLRDSGIHKD